MALGKKFVHHKLASATSSTSDGHVQPDGGLADACQEEAQPHILTIAPFGKLGGDLWRGSCRRFREAGSRPLERTLVSRVDRRSDVPRFFLCWESVECISQPHTLFALVPMESTTYQHICL